jgi:glutathione S-transferase
MITLYHAAGSVCAQKVRLALAEMDLPWESRLLDMAKGEQLDPAYLALNREGVVPTLVHDGLVVRESSLIVEYLDGLSAAPLMPADAEGRQSAKLWLLRTFDIHPTISTLSFATIFREHERARRTPAEIDAWLASMPNPSLRERRRELIERGADSIHVDGALFTLRGTLRDMGAALERREWLGGERYGLADLALTAYVDRLDRLAMAGLWSLRYPRVGEWLAAVRARPSYEVAIASYVPADFAAASRRAGENAWSEIARRFEMLHR